MSRILVRCFLAVSRIWNIYLSWLEILVTILHKTEFLLHWYLLGTIWMIMDGCHYSLADPNPWLILSDELKREDLLKPYGEFQFSWSIHISRLQSRLNGSHQMLRKACGCLTVKEVSMKPWLTRSKEKKWVGTLVWKSTFTFSCLWQANVKVGWEEKTFKASQLMQVNPPKMEK